MPDLLALLPVTVIAAIALFALKEGIEFVRRKGADARKIHALKALIARECELNYWTVKSLRAILINVPDPNDENPQIEVRIERHPSGRPIARILSLDDGTSMTRGLPEVHRDLMSKYLLDIATLDKSFFAVLEPAYDALAELDHVRQSLLTIRDEEAEHQMKGLFGSFAQYARDEVAEAETALKSLFHFCTGKKLEKHRLR